MTTTTEQFTRISLVAESRPSPVQEDRMGTYKVGYFFGSLSSTSINRTLSRALIRLAPEELEFTELPIGCLPLYSPDFDSEYPAEPQALKDAIAGSQAVLFVTPEYIRSIPGALKKAIDWASRPWGQNSFDHMPAAVIGASPGRIGTAVGQQSLRAVLSFCSSDDGARGVHHVHARSVHRRRRGHRRHIPRGQERPTGLQLVNSPHEAFIPVELRVPDS